jgi:SnoaL-like domain
MSPVDETRLRQLSDRAEIIDVQHRYATGVDTRNWELLRTCFTDELEADFSSGFGAPVVRLKADEWIESIAPVMGALKATQHTITNHVITFDDDDHATCVAYVQARHHNPNPTGDCDHTVYGFYTNHFERTSNEWRITKCKLTVSWMTGNFGLFGLLSQ